jgi:hypothetical protein
LFRARQSLKNKLSEVREDLWGIAVAIRVRVDQAKRRFGFGDGSNSGVLAASQGATNLMVIGLIGMASMLGSNGRDGLAARLPVQVREIAIAESADFGHPHGVVPGVANSQSPGDSVADGTGPGTFELALVARRGGSNGGSTTTIDGPSVGEGQPSFEVTVENYGTEKPPEQDPVASVVYQLSERLCLRYPATCETG